MKKKLSVMLDPALVAAVDNEAQRQRASRSQIVEESLRAWRGALLEHQCTSWIKSNMRCAFL